MSQDILVLCFMLIALLLSASFYFEKNIFKYTAIIMLFLLANLVYFTIDSYKGSPADNIPNKARILSIEIRNPSEGKEGKIYVWVYDQADKTYSFFFFTAPKDVPMSFSIKYTDKSQKAFAKAKELLDNGYPVYLTSDQETDTVGGPKAKSAKPGKGENRLQYETGKPSISIVNPEELLKKPGSESPDQQVNP